MSRLKLWNIMPISRLAARSSLSESAVMSAPSTVTVPLVGRSSRFMQRTSVLLPAPERPMMPKISPASMSRETSSRAWTAVLPVPKVLQRLRISISAKKITPNKKVVPDA